MIFYLIIFLILITILIGTSVWIYRLFKLYKRGKTTSFWIQTSILGIILIFITWNLGIFPLSKNFQIKERTELLTGQTFWSWKEFDYEEIGVRGEGYTLDIYKFNEEYAQYFKNPDSTFFENYPPENMSEIKWTPTPIKDNEIDILEFATPIYGGWKGEIVTKQDFIRNVAKNKGAYYAYRKGGGTDFFLISPKDRLVILINHNM
ncbi:hypothetical protein [uncultured Kriegella sp.]|uniref:hypothetical protein n=1 Tax=uncultured Kriegella sp. TaxID=1798910 RepID=UPI0030D96529|tara:strand:- start:458883 stop:459497 length:615 start_codon:yes stop_codon:yes gene_type:complete